jgi:hypothetical protein
MNRLATALAVGLLALGFLGCATAKAPRRSASVPPPSAKPPCDASVDVQPGPPRIPFAEITSVSIRCRDTRDVVLHAAGAARSITTRWRNDRTLVVSIPSGVGVLDRSQPKGGVAVEFEPRLREADLLYGALPTHRWPSTCADGARQVIAGLSPESTAIIRELSPGDFAQLRRHWGALLARHFALEDENLAMLASCGGPPGTSAGADLVDLIGAGLRGRPDDIDAAAAALRGKRAQPAR